MLEEILKDVEAKTAHLSKEKELDLFTPEELVKEWAKAVEGDLDRPLTTCIPSIDKDLRNKLRGTVGAYIGYGGSKKSLLALQACRTNVVTHKNNCTGIYANMEMAVFQMMSRLIDMSFEVEDYNWNVSHHYEKYYADAYRMKNKESMAEIINILSQNFKEMYGRNLYINSQSGMRVEDFDKLLKKAKKSNGVVDMLVIDGLSMMAGSGSETESYTTNSKELKDLAKHHKVYIPLICHLSKGADKHTRDIQKYIRGSEKILDNVDFVIQMSLIIDEFKSDKENIEYENDRGFIKFFNKRGSGNTINVIYNFDCNKLLITESSQDPKSLSDTKEKNSFKF
jgi:replicative DNA helicase